MATIKVKHTTIRKKNSSQPKLYAKRVVINNQMQRLKSSSGRR